MGAGGSKQDVVDPDMDEPEDEEEQKQKREEAEKLAAANKKDDDDVGDAKSSTTNPSRRLFALLRANDVKVRPRVCPCQLFSFLHYIQREIPLLSLVGHDDARRLMK